MILVGKPGSVGNKFFIKSTSIVAADLIIFLRGADKYKEFEATFTVDFWECIAGEESTGGMCNRCESGFYSIDPEQETCYPCMDNVNCTGGSELVVEEGYWRDNLL